MATQASILACKIPWTEEPGGCSPSCGKELGMTDQLSMRAENSHAFSTL